MTEPMTDEGPGFIDNPPVGLQAMTEATTSIIDELKRCYRRIDYLAQQNASLIERCRERIAERDVRIRELEEDLANKNGLWAAHFGMDSIAPASNRKIPLDSGGGVAHTVDDG